MKETNESFSFHFTIFMLVYHIKTSIKHAEVCRWRGAKCEKVQYFYTNHSICTIKFQSHVNVHRLSTSILSYHQPTHPPTPPHPPNNKQRHTLKLETRHASFQVIQTSVRVAGVPVVDLVGLPFPLPGDPAVLLLLSLVLEVAAEGRWGRKGVD